MSLSSTTVVRVAVSGPYFFFMSIIYLQWEHHDLVASRAVFSLSKFLLLTKGRQVQPKEH